MLEEKDLQAIAKMLSDAEQRIAKNTVALMDAEFKPRFNLLAEELENIKNRLPDPDELEKMQEELDLHYIMLKKHTKEIQSLKKAN